MQTLKKSDIGDIFGIEGDAFKNQEQEKSPFMHPQMTLLIKEPADPSGEIPWTDRHRYALSSEICGSDHESRM